ncbi:TrbL/VirB6 plasmid conjugal transfer protein [Geobacter metallireducens RCH3]|uniref:type IV secretion system protein n=1 Tax=Geobacter metallireducens TaxID=28232 RepID=UPI00024A5261|nr:type IV secretion system protein [Geobacter metallireducens]EHP83955.1 TrbL/VirB6 plasmid conjugal transfer protein [Geobacter metallireducens RCH3]
MVKKILTIGFFIFLVQGVARSGLAEIILDGFIAVGLKAGGAGVSFSMKNPSSLISAGFLAADPIYDAIQHMAITAIGDRLMAYGCYLIVILAYVVMACQIMITFIEFGIVSTLGIILLPFGISKHTAFLSEKAIGAIIAFGIKLMVLSFVVAVIQPVLLALPALGPDPTFNQMMTLGVTVAVIAFVVAQAPGVASAVLSGSPSLSAGAAAGTALSAAAGAAAPAMAAAGMATGGAAVAGGLAGAKAAAAAGNGSFLGNVARAAAGAMPGASAFQAAKSGAISAAEAGSAGGIKPASGGSSLKPAADAAAKGAADTGKTEATPTPAPAADTTATTTDATPPATGSADTTATDAGKTEPAPTTGTGGGTSSLQGSNVGSGGGNGKGQPRRSSLQDAWQQSQRAVPQDASAGGGAGVRLHVD